MKAPLPKKAKTPFERKGAAITNLEEVIQIEFKNKFTLQSSGFF
jgi:hypothetical protein